MCGGVWRQHLARLAQSVHSFLLVTTHSHWTRSVCPLARADSPLNLGKNIRGGVGPSVRITQPGRGDKRR
jgi:hypothetical protein